METDYIQTQEHRRWTFDDDKIRKWVLENLTGRVLNACAGKNQLPHNQSIIRNDLDPTVEADLHVDVTQLAAELERGEFRYNSL